MPKYTLVAKSRASAIFYPGKGLYIEYVSLDGREVRCAFVTNYLDGYSAPLPQNLCVEARGEAENLPMASQRFYNAAQEICNLMAFAVNAHLGNLDVELVYDCSPELQEHEFVQSFVSDEPITSIPARSIEPELVQDFLRLVHGSAESKRVQTAIGQYCEALKKWNSGHGVICLVHLYMGIEALTKAMLREYLRKNEITEDRLISEWRIDKKQLDSEVRRRLIFGGDVLCFKIAREVSDSFEHGFGSFSEMQKPAAEIVFKTAGYLREAIFKLVEAPKSLVDVLLASPYSRPRGPILTVKKLKGTLVGPIDKLPKEGNAHPILFWKSRIKEVSLDENGQFVFKPEEKLTAHIGEGVVLKIERWEHWDRQLLDPQDKKNHLTPSVKISVAEEGADKTDQEENSLEAGGGR